jgi:hypothetical protein
METFTLVVFLYGLTAQRQDMPNGIVPGLSKGQCEQMRAIILKENPKAVAYCAPHPR